MHPPNNPEFDPISLAKQIIDLNKEVDREVRNGQYLRAAVLPTSIHCRWPGDHRLENAYKILYKPSWPRSAAFSFGEPRWMINGDLQNRPGEKRDINWIRCSAAPTRMTGNR